MELSSSTYPQAVWGKPPSQSLYKTSLMQVCWEKSITTVDHVHPQLLDPTTMQFFRWLWSTNDFDHWPKMINDLHWFNTQQMTKIWWHCFNYILIQRWLYLSSDIKKQQWTKNTSNSFTTMIRNSKYRLSESIHALSGQWWCCTQILVVFCRGERITNNPIPTKSIFPWSLQPMLSWWFVLDIHNWVYA